jgi:hypothetical protein
MAAPRGLYFRYYMQHIVVLPTQKPELKALQDIYLCPILQKLYQIIYIEYYSSLVFESSSLPIW